MFIELLTAIGIGTRALPSDASEPTPIIDYPDPTEVMCLAENMYHEGRIKELLVGVQLRV